MKNFKILKITFFLLCALTSKAWALIPIEGIVFGNVADIKQYDPFAGMLSSIYFLSEQESSKELAKLNYFIASYKQGYELTQTCNSSTRVTYSSEWKKDSAMRSVAATLQYIGLDLAVKSIVNYAKKLNYTEDKFKILYENLVHNTCSQNLTVYSHKMLKNNFRYYWANSTNFENPEIATNPYFDNYIKQYHSTKDSIEKSFYYSVINFRGLCSWNSDVENFALMAPYIKNPFLMSIVFNNISKRKLKLDPKTGQALLVKASDGIQVACENMICRKSDEEKFTKYFPRIDGSDDLTSDLKLLYCNHLQNAKMDISSLPEDQKKWVGEQSPYVKNIEAMHLFSLFTGIPEFSVTADKFTDLTAYLKNNIKYRWDNWSQAKTNQFTLEQLYEEPLEVTLLEFRDRYSLEKNRFQVNFSVTLGEIDKMIDDYNKIDLEFNLRFEKRFIAYLRERIPFLYNIERDKELRKVEAGLVTKILAQLKDKEKNLKVRLWNDQLANIIAEELITQILASEDNSNENFQAEFVEIPINFSFGSYALQYIRYKNIYQNKSKQILTFN